MRLQVGVVGNDFTIKMSFPFYFNLITCLGYSLESSHRLFISFRQGVLTQGFNISKCRQVCPCQKQPWNSYTVRFSWQYPSTLREGNSGSLNSHPLRPCEIVNLSVRSLCTSHIRAFLLWFTLQLYPHVGISPIVLGLGNRFRNT